MNNEDLIYAPIVRRNPLSSMEAAAIRRSVTDIYTLYADGTIEDLFVLYDEQPIYLPYYDRLVTFKSDRVFKTYPDDPDEDEVGIEITDVERIAFPELGDESICVAISFMGGLSVELLKKD